MFITHILIYQIFSIWINQKKKKILPHKFDTPNIFQGQGFPLWGVEFHTIMPCSWDKQYL